MSSSGRAADVGNYLNKFQYIIARTFKIRKAAAYLTQKK